MRWKHLKCRSAGLLNLRHRLEIHEAVSEEMAKERGRFEALAKPESAARAVSSFNLFQTPVELARKVAGMVPLRGRILEPSAGLGRLYRAIREVSADPVTLVENSTEIAGELYAMTEEDDNARLIVADFLETDADRLGGLFDAVVMNPPFKMGRDIKHVRHALSLLAPGGHLVSIVANGPRQRRALMPEADHWEDLPEGAFKETYTNVRAAVAVFSK